MSGKGINADKAPNGLCLFVQTHPVQFLFQKQNQCNLHTIYTYIVETVFFSKGQVHL